MSHQPFPKGFHLFLFETNVTSACVGVYIQESREGTIKGGQRYTQRDTSKHRLQNHIWVLKMWSPLSPFSLSTYPHYRNLWGKINSEKLEEIASLTHLPTTWFRWVLKPVAMIHEEHCRFFSSTFSQSEYRSGLMRCDLPWDPDAEPVWAYCRHLFH